MELARSLAPFRHRAFARVWIGAFVSNVGTWMETIAVGVLVTEQTDQALWGGLAMVAGFVPMAVLSPVGGALADRIHRRQLLLMTVSGQLVMATLLTILAIADVTPPGLVVLIVFGTGCVQALGFPAYQAILPDLVPTDDLVGAVALSSAQWNLGRVVGPLAAGVAIAVGGYPWAFGINAASFVAVIVAIAPLRLPRPSGRSHPSILGSIREGLRFVGRDPGLRVVVGYMALNTLLAAPFIALVAPMAVKVFDSGAGGTAALVTAQGLGAVVMALSLGVLANRFGPRRVMIAVLWLLPPALALYGLAPTLPVAVVAIFIVGFLYLGALSSFTSIGQLRSPSHVRGRVMSTLMVILGTLYPLGSLIQGATADRVGLRTTTVAAATILAGVLLAARTARPALADELDGPAAEGALIQDGDEGTSHDHRT